MRARLGNEMAKPVLKKLDECVEEDHEIKDAIFEQNEILYELLEKKIKINGLPFFRSNKKDVNKLKRYRIGIIYGEKKEKEFADLIFKDLNQLENNCSLLSQEEYKKGKNGRFDYRVYLGNIEEYNLKDFNKEFSEFGCEIYRKGIDVIVLYDAKINLSGIKEEFIRYYEEEVTDTINRSKNADQAKKILEKKKVQDISDSEGMVFIEKWSELGKTVAESTNKVHNLLKIPMKMVSALLFTVSIMVVLPTSLSLLLLSETKKKLVESDFDTKFVSEAQRQILQIKIKDYFMGLQLGCDEG